jgi:hypothetical protein
VNLISELNLSKDHQSVHEAELLNWPRSGVLISAFRAEILTPTEKLSYNCCENYPRPLEENDALFLLEKFVQNSLITKTIYSALLRQTLRKGVVGYLPIFIYNSEALSLSTQP